jgi:hypothetical protein
MGASRSKVSNAYGSEDERMSHNSTVDDTSRINHPVANYESRPWCWHVELNPPRDRVNDNSRSHPLHANVNILLKFSGESGIQLPA